MNKRQIQQKFKNKKALINYNELYHFKDKDPEKLSTIDGKLYTSQYMLKSTIIDDLNQIAMGFLDDFWPYNNKDKFKIRPDDITLQFIGSISDDIASYAMKLAEKDKYIDTEDVEYEIPMYIEYVLWRIYLSINEINKYIYGKPLFEFAEEVANGSGEEEKSIRDFCDVNIKEWRRTLWVLFDKIGDKEPIITELN